MLKQQLLRTERNSSADTFTANRIKAGCIVCKNALETDRDYLHQLVDLDFTQADTFDEASDFTNVFGVDGVTTQDENGVTVTSTPFTSTIVTGNEHVKWLKFHKTVFPVPEEGEVLYEARVAVAQSIDSEDIPTEYLPRIRNIREDIRLCSGAMNMIDVATWMVFDFLIADDMIYAFYERLPFGKPSFGGSLEDYAAFSHAIPVHRRASSDPLNDFVDLAIGVRQNSVRYLVNGSEVFRVPRLGLYLNDEYLILDHGGLPEEVTVTSVSCGFGTFSLLDMALPNNYARELVITDGGTNLPNRNVSHLAQIDLTANYRETYSGLDGRNRALTDVAGAATSTFAVSLANVQASPNTYKLFGQGSTIRLQNFKVSARCSKNDADADVRYVPNTLVDLTPSV